MGEYQHRPVLLEEAVEALNIRPDGKYLDGTFGRGGHSRAILARLSGKGCLYSLDRDPEAVAAGKELQEKDSRISLVRGNFADVERYVREWGVEEGLDQLTKNLDRAIQQADDYQDVMVLLETTAGQGTGLGASFEELAYIIHASVYSKRLGVCFDTCHAFAAGYDLGTATGYDKTFTDFDTIIGLERLKFFHLNDSKKGIGSRVDRHEHIGKGKIGLEGFRRIMNDPRFTDHPMVLETPKEKDLKEDIKNLKLLRSLIKPAK